MKNLKAFTEAYGNLDDAVVLDVCLSYAADFRPEIKVAINCMSLVKDYSWVHLELTFYGVKEFRITAARNMSIDVVESFAVVEWDGEMWFNFSPRVVPPETKTEHRDSDFYIVCKDLNFQESDFKPSL
ncbi:hypothetical protein [Hymenobacter sp. BT491]|uniref:hypothetical protein n=1 Tax=Hymenobacter sp. BT491 TaxID=2766779 RepID=UPI001653A9E2|nr:hypothetical protein [Hymenobacter sp. BT491]MBC6989220.1 hypothetical protein [Hymenobacter sp. BT491]